MKIKEILYDRKKQNFLTIFIDSIFASPPRKLEIEVTKSPSFEPCLYTDKVSEVQILALRRGLLPLS